jgi:hypothetical protein
MKKYIAVLFLTVASYGATIYDNAAAWNSDTNHHAMTQLNNGNTGPFTVTGAGVYGYDGHNMLFALDFETERSIDISLSDGGWMSGFLFGGSTAWWGPGSGLVVSLDGVQVDNFATTGIWSGNWGVTSEPFKTVTISTNPGLAWEHGEINYLKAARSDAPSEVPEPTTMGLFGLGLVGIGALSRKK